MASGDAKSDFWWLILMLAILGVAWFVTGGPSNPESRKPFIEPPAPLNSGATSYIAPSYPANPSPEGAAGSSLLPAQTGAPTDNQSTYPGQFTINSGNARYEYQPNQEYISLYYNGRVPLDITGWYLTNGKGNRFYNPNGDQLVRLKSDVVVLSRVSKLNTQSNLIVLPGGEVTIVTGNPPPGSALPPQASFQLNRCSGYLGNLSDVRFTPDLGNYSCPAPRDWPSVAGIDNDCYHYVNYLGTCHTPKFERRSDGFDYVDGQVNKLSSLCTNFVKQTFNYAGCVATFSSQPDFYQPAWRLYLGRPWELWASERETITLYDKNNKMVAQAKY